MAKVTFLETLLSNTASPVEGLNALRKEIKREIRTETNKQLPPYGINRATIDDAVEQLRISAYLAGKGMVILRPETVGNSNGKYVAYPYNLDPILSVAALVALREVYKRANLSVAGIPERMFDFESSEEKLVTMALRYILESQPDFSSRRMFAEKSVYDAARNFFGAYGEVKSRLEANPRDAAKNLALLLSFAATYRRINQYKDTPTFHLSMPSEFVKAIDTEVDMNEVLGYIDGNPVKKYLVPGKLDAAAGKNPVLRTHLWKVVNAKIEPAPASR